jgi:hypothetical protein
MSLKDYGLSGFDRLNIRGAFDVEIKKADAFKVSVDADVFKPVQVDRDGDMLRISLPWYYMFWGFLTWFTRARIYISMPELRELVLSGASRAEADSFSTTHDCSLDVAGASHLKMGEIKCGSAVIKIVGASDVKLKKLQAAGLKLEMSGASRIVSEVVLTAGVDIKIVGASRAELSGEANGLKLEMAGASQVKLGELSTHNARVKLAGASRAVVKVDGRLDAEVVGASDLSWAGNPVMGDIKSVGASQLHKA